MSDFCVPCKDEGRGMIVAHFKEITAQRSPTGKRIPAMCYDHKNGLDPKAKHKSSYTTEPERPVQAPRQTETPRDPIPPTVAPGTSKWGATIDELLLLAPGQSRVVIVPADESKTKYANKMRSMLAISKRTAHLQFKVSAMTPGYTLLVTLRGSWQPSPELAKAVGSLAMDESEDENEQEELVESEAKPEVDSTPPPITESSDTPVESSAKPMNLVTIWSAMMPGSRQRAIDEHFERLPRETQQDLLISAAVHQTAMIARVEAEDRARN